jgi:hypothetical protein
LERHSIQAPGPLSHAVDHHDMMLPGKSCEAQRTSSFIHSKGIFTLGQQVLLFLVRSDDENRLCISTSKGVV